MRRLDLYTSTNNCKKLVCKNVADTFSYMTDLDCVTMAKELTED
jgi:hypothetical protein